TTPAALTTSTEVTCVKNRPLSVIEAVCPPIATVGDFGVAWLTTGPGVAISNARVWICVLGIRDGVAICACETSLRASNKTMPQTAKHTRNRSDFIFV